MCLSSLVIPQHTMYRKCTHGEMLPTCQATRQVCPGTLSELPREPAEVQSSFHSLAVHVETYSSIFQHVHTHARTDAPQITMMHLPQNLELTEYKAAVSSCTPCRSLIYIRQLDIAMAVQCLCRVNRECPGNSQSPDRRHPCFA